MPTIALTDRFCSAAKTLAGVRTDYFDETVSGLALRVTPNGHRSWSFTFTSPRDDKRARITIGTYPATTLASARAKALEARTEVEEGNDPRFSLGSAGAAAMTVADMVKSFLAKPHRRTGKPRKSVSEIKRRFDRNVLPLIGTMKVSELHRRDVTRCIDPIVKRGRPVEAARCFEDLRAMIRWGVGRGDLDRNIVDGMDRPAETAPRNRVLSEDEIATLWGGLPKALSRSKQCQQIIKLCLVTGQRVGEVAGLSRAELDLKNRLWTLPGSRTKNGQSHSVPLSDLAVSIMEEALSEPGDSEFMFPCGDASLAPAAVARTILRANCLTEEHPHGRFGVGSSWSAHDLRRTALTGMARLGVAPIVLGHVANHRSTTRAGVTLAVYSQYTYDREKREALDLWASRLSGIVGGNVAQIRRMPR